MMRSGKSVSKLFGVRNHTQEGKMADEKTVAEIERELAAARDELSQRQTELAEAERKVDQINEKYDEQSARAINYNDQQASRVL
jgi:hypothetical protein